LEELAGSEDLNAEGCDCGKVADVVRDDGEAFCGDGELSHHVVVGISQERSPKEKDLLPVRERADAVDEVADVAWFEGSSDVAKQNIFVLEDQRNRDGWLEVAVFEVLKQSE
jgi:hypothetical protein